MTIRIALLGQRPGDELDALASGLERLDYRVDILSPRPLPLPERLLGARGFAGPLTQLPSLGYALGKGDYDVAHAFSAVDAAVALRWGQRRGRPVVFTCTEPIGRDSVADRRLRLRLLTAAVEDSNAVLAPTDAVRESLWRWFAVHAPLLDPKNASGHDQLYRRLLGTATKPSDRLLP